MTDFDKLALEPVIRILGKPAAYTPPGAAAPLDLPDLKAAFNAAHEFVDLSGEVPISTTKPAALVRLADFPAENQPTREGVLTIRGKAYKIIDLQPDGEGGMLLPLHEMLT